MPFLRQTVPQHELAKKKKKKYDYIEFGKIE